MADSDTSEQPELGGHPLTDFPDAQFPTVYADAASSIASGGGVVKFYLMRFDANMWGRGGVTGNPFMQVVIPVHGFAQMTLFFQNHLKTLIAKNAISEEQVHQLEAGLAVTKEGEQ